MALAWLLAWLWCGFGVALAWSEAGDCLAEMVLVLWAGDCGYSSTGLSPTDEVKRGPPRAPPDFEERCWALGGIKVSSAVTWPCCSAPGRRPLFCFLNNSSGRGRSLREVLGGPGQLLGGEEKLSVTPGHLAALCSGAEPTAALTATRGPRPHRQRGPGTCIWRRLCCSRWT